MRGMDKHEWTDAMGRKWCAVADAGLSLRGVDFVTSKPTGDVDEIDRIAPEEG